MKRIFSLSLLLLVVLVADAQITMRERIISLPDSILPLLTQVNREDCVDFLEAGMQARVTNRFGSVTELTELTADYACWQYTAGTQYEMKLLPLTDSLQVLCMTHRLLDPVNDASVRFFDMQWNVLPTGRFITLPATADPTSLLTTTDCALSPASTDLTVTVRSEHFTAEDTDNADASLRVTTQPCLFQWQSGRYVKAE